MNKKLEPPNLWSAIIGVIGLIIGAVFGYFGNKVSADAQIRVAQENANAQITAVWIQVYGPIYTTQTAEVKAVGRALSITPADNATVTPEETPTKSFSNAILVMNNFYDWINNARNRDDLLKSWNLETSGPNGLQCNEVSGCDFSKFSDFWLQWNVQYKLYDCGSNIVDTEQSYYDKDPKLATTPTTPAFVRYQLVEDQGELKLNRGTIIEAPGADCKLEISVP